MEKADESGGWLDFGSTLFIDDNALCLSVLFAFILCMKVKPHWNLDSMSWVMQWQANYIPSQPAKSGGCFSQRRDRLTDCLSPWQTRVSVGLPSNICKWSRGELVNFSSGLPMYRTKEHTQPLCRCVLTLTDNEVFLSWLPSLRCMIKHSKEQSGKPVNFCCKNVSSHWFSQATILLSWIAEIMKVTLKLLWWNRTDCVSWTKEILDMHWIQVNRQKLTCN